MIAGTDRRLNLQLTEPVDFTSPSRSPVSLIRPARKRLRKRYMNTLRSFHSRSL
jgi:hypothetical protein